MGSELSDKEKAYAALTEIRMKCEQYWNEHGICDAEVHAALEWIHVQANTASLNINAAIRDAVKAEREACADLAQFDHECKRDYGMCDCRSEIGRAIRARTPQQETHDA